jgi:hypothetical protein
MNGETGSYFSLRASVQFTLDLDKTAHDNRAEQKAYIVELFGDVYPLSQTEPVVLGAVEPGAHRYRYKTTVNFPLEAVGTSLNYRVRVRSVSGNSTEYMRIPGTISLSAGRSLVALDAGRQEAGRTGNTEQANGQYINLAR